jgi:hypothetical protein
MRLVIVDQNGNVKILQEDDPITVELYELDEKHRRDIDAIAARAFGQAELFQEGPQEP